MKRNILFYTLITALIFIQSTSYADLSGSDDFSFEDLTKWQQVNNYDGSTFGGQLFNISGQAAYSVLSAGGDDFAAYGWILNSAPKTTSWTAQVDAFLPNDTFDIDQYAGIGLLAYWPEAVPAGEPERMVEVALEFDEGVRDFYAMKKTGPVDGEIGSITTSTFSGSLRLEWNASTELFSCFYDIDGGQDSWLYLTSVDIADWNMPSTDSFGVAVAAFSGNKSLDVTDGLAFDNFITSTTVPEPSVMLLFGLGLFGVLRKKSR